jgi:hypothetical protein
MSEWARPAAVILHLWAALISAGVTKGEPYFKACNPKLCLGQACQKRSAV